jgi:NitT/TauT family transport system substrate-binding protein
VMRRLLPSLALVALLLSACGGAGAPAAHPPQKNGAAPAASSPSPSTPSPSPSASAAARITVAYGNTSGTYTPLYVAKEDGFFRRNGLDVRLVNATGKDIAPLLNGAVQIADADGNYGVTAIAKGAKIVYFAADLKDYGFQCWASPSVRSVADLKGKTLALSEPGQAVDSAGRAMLAKFGLSPSDVRLVYISSVPSRVAALIVHKVDAIVISAPQGLRAQKAGFRMLYDLAKLPYMSSGYVTTRAYLRGHPAVITAFLKSLRQSIAFIKDPANKARVEAAMSRYTQIKDPSLLDNAYAYYVPQWSTDLGIPGSVLDVSIKWVEDHDRNLHVNAADLVDLSLVKKLQS